MKQLTRRFHQTKAYKLNDWRKIRINAVNALYRGGFTFKEIAEMLEVSTTTVQRYYYGFADNCLGYNPNGYFPWSKDTRAVMYEGARCKI